MRRSLLEYRPKALTPVSTFNSRLRMLGVPCYAMDLKGLYVYTPFETTTEFETLPIRTCPKINVYLFEGSVSLVLCGYCQGVLKRLQVPLQTQGGMTVMTQKLYQYPQLQR